FVDGERLWRRLGELAAAGATGRGGVRRLALGPEEAQARRLVAGWARARGFSVTVDGIGNLFVRRAGRDPDAPPVLTGSHLDTQPSGGRFDGAYGVLAALEVLEALEDGQLCTDAPVVAVAWTNEEGARFQPGTMGSAVFAGQLELASALAARDSDGVRVADALARVLEESGVGQVSGTGFPLAAYVEAHIEQGPVLEEARVPVGAVTGIQGLRWFEVSVRGEQGHAGTLPESRRRDALMGAVEVVHALRGQLLDQDDLLRFTVGRFECAPGSPNTIPGRVLFSIDLRHPDAAVLAARGDLIADVCRRAAGPCEVSVRETMSTPPVAFDPRIVELVESSAGRLDLDCLRLPSGAGHDAGHLARLCPTGMLFVPCAGGRSHTETESAEPQDLTAGARVLADVVCQLANG
ncbi:MAG: Zn-dependent hydrolase, partial [Planctomycetota bacterium]